MVVIVVGRSMDGRSRVCQRHSSYQTQQHFQDILDVLEVVRHEPIAGSIKTVASVGSGEPVLERVLEGRGL